MMVSSESQNAFSKKIEVALSFPKKRVVVDGATPKSNMKIRSCEEYLQLLKMMRLVYINGRAKDKFQHSSRLISSRFPSHQFIMKSNVLSDRKLFDAIVYSKIFENELELAQNRDEYEGQLVWLLMQLPSRSGLPPIHTTVFLISEKEIIYEMSRNSIDMIREELKRSWEFFKEEVEINVIEALSASVPIPEPSEYVADLQSASSAEVASDAPPSKRQKMDTMTEETKKILLDELSSLNLDPQLKQRFESDMELLADKDENYWRARLDGLRGCSNSAPVGSAQSPELEQLRQKVAELEKITASLHDEIPSASNVSERLSKVEELVGRIESRLSSSTDKASPVCQIESHLSYPTDEASKEQVDAPCTAMCENMTEEQRKAEQREAEQKKAEQRKACEEELLDYEEKWDYEEDDDVYPVHKTAVCRNESGLSSSADKASKEQVDVSITAMCENMTESQKKAEQREAEQRKASEEELLDYENDDDDEYTVNTRAVNPCRMAIERLKESLMKTLNDAMEAEKRRYNY